jgi:signal transduction histidine kinase
MNTALRRASDRVCAPHRLAIVRQVAETHGGVARAVNAEGGGARLRVSFFEKS